MSKRTILIKVFFSQSVASNVKFFRDKKLKKDIWKQSKPAKESNEEQIPLTSLSFISV